MQINEARLFDELRERLFNGAISQSQVDGIKALLNAWHDDYSEYPIQYLAYCLATSFHETGATMQPVREGFAKSDESARAIVTRMFKRGRIKRNYAAPHAVTGHAYYGRGYVQLTWSYNYKKAGKELNMKLFENPDKVMRPEIAAKILYSGCIEGWFTNKKLSDFITETSCNYRQCRRIVNGMDKASLIAGYAKKFETALIESQSTEVTVKRLERAGSRTVKATKSNDDAGGAIIGLGVAGGVAEALSKFKAVSESLMDTVAWMASYWWVAALTAGGVVLWNNRSIIKARIDDELKIRRIDDV